MHDSGSYARLVKCEHSSGGKRHGTGGAKIGNVHLKWAFSEAAALYLRNNSDGQKHLRRLAGRHGKAKALSILAAKLGRAVYVLLSRERAFDAERFLARSEKERGWVIQPPNWSRFREEQGQTQEKRLGRSRTRFCAEVPTPRTREPRGIRPGIHSS